MELDAALDVWLNEVNNLVPNLQQRKKITLVGAEVYKRALHDVTKTKHYSGDRDTSKVDHLADSIEVSNANIDYIVDGSSLVGFTAKGINHARIARLLNDGTKFIPADHFVDETRRNSRHAVLVAQYAEYQRLLKGGK
ncbi:prophage pi3 protein 19 [Leuconostoc kimchii IMSNU 11154]|uniref:Prophage pi3 protein 19 n=1 Tax=Leuconostoc kimchii (strain IMSNU 11154 / KCTC 2386 / IH25) TaxID=762051 RepID=D5T0U8_LEUKI|nr:HK97 gp10 family phage protein [Leuconostoc kimchii]ADG39897.1 prophage pi3 protein 19 [Leuconostoc kimchii IMSNU 11154]